MRRNKNVKYILQRGFAYYAEKDMKKLEEMAREGWILKGFTLGGFYYKLVKGEPQELSYSWDDHHVKISEKEEYYKTFRKAGWELVDCVKSKKKIYGTIFVAPAGTIPIYTDDDAKVYNYRQTKKSYAIGIGISMVIQLFIEVIANLIWRFNLPHIISVLADAVTTIFIAVPAIYILMMVVYFERERRGRPSVLVYLIILILLALFGAGIARFRMLARC